METYVARRFLPFNPFFRSLLFRFSFLSLFFFSFSVGMAWGGQVTLAWDPNTDSDLAGYKIYYGTRSGLYDQIVDVGNVTVYTISGLQAGVTYYFAATAYTYNGLESGYSNEVMYAVPPCTYTLSSSQVSFPYGGGSETITLTAPSGCPWTVSTPPAWVSVRPLAGNGSATITFSVLSQTQRYERTAALTVAGNLFTVFQSGLPGYTIQTVAGTGGEISPAGEIWVPAGQDQTFTITPLPGYRIAEVTVDGRSQGPVSSYSFVSINAPHTLSAAFAEDPATPNVYTVTAEIVGGWGHGTIQPLQQTVGRGAAATFNLSTETGYTATVSGCEGVLSGSQYTTGIINGPCTVSVSFSETATALPIRNSRSGRGYASLQEAYNAAGDGDVILVQGRTFSESLVLNRGIRVTLQGGLKEDFSGGGSGLTTVRGSIQIPAGGGIVSINNFVLSGQEASSDLTAQGSSRSGDGETPSEASGTAGAECGGINVTPNSLSVPASGGEGALTVQADPVCPWEVSADVDWIVIREPEAGRSAGEGKVSLWFAAHEGAETRSGNILIGGRTVPVVQEGLCAFQLSADHGEIGAAGGSPLPVQVIASSPSCTWRATSNVPWITIASPENGQALGSGPLSFNVAANDGPERNGSIQVAGLTYSMQQSGKTGGSSSTVKILRTGQTFATLQEAYEAAASGDVIQLRQGTISGSLSVHRDIQVTLIGGYLTDFSGYSGTATTIQGSIRSLPGGGSVQIGNIMLTE